MGHFAQVTDGIVEQVLVCDTAAWCETNLGGIWVQTSYNTQGGVHTLGGTPLHKNYAGKGYSWDGTGFAAPQPYPSWTLDVATYQWSAPTPMPTEGMWTWNEATLSWDAVVLS